jgi:outer membrane protein assembly factor BamB
LRKIGNAKSFTPIVVNNKVVFQCLRSIHCYEITSGKLLWEYITGVEGFASSVNKYAEGKVFVRGTEKLFAFDLNSGVLLWETPNHYGVELAGCMDYYKGRLYFTGIDMKDVYNSTMLFCLDGSTGELIWKDGGVNRTGMMADGVIIDQSTGYLYATDAYRIMCIDLNNSPKPRLN